jgi:CubicO group peptidase (beta-lactamase class C family)
MLNSVRFTLSAFAALVLLSCSDARRAKSDGTAEETDTMVRLMPSRIELPKLSDGYKKQMHDKVARFADKLWNKNDYYAFLVARNGQVIYEEYSGYVNQKKSYITATTPLHIASVSKVLTAAAVLKLIDADKIELDQKVNTILPAFPYPEITIKTLLNHRSGLQNYAYFTSRKDIWNTKDTLTNQDILDIMALKELPLAFKTDKHFTYCNTNYAILALVIEKITGLKYPEAMRRMIFEPLGMNDTYVFELKKDRRRASATFKGNMPLAFDFLDAVYGDKNIYSTPRDLLKFDMATYSPDFLNKRLLKKVFKGYSYESKGTKNYGLGIRMIEWKTGQKFFFHNGWWHGNTSAYVTLRDEKTTIIALSNRFTKKTYLVRKLAPAFGDYPFEKDDKDDLLE